MHGSADDDYRVVVDEGSLDWRGRTDEALRDTVDNFADLLEPLADGRQVGLIDDVYSIECWESVNLMDISYTPDRRVSRDSRVRLARLLDKCRTIELQDDDIPESIRLHDVEMEPSWGMAHVLARAASGRSMSCLIVPPSVHPSGWTAVQYVADQRATEIHILTDPAYVPDFWRGIFERESVSEPTFFGLAHEAYPRLMFAEDLTFHRFWGAYADVLPWLVKLLGGINDHFAEAVERLHGDRNRIIAEFSAYGLTVSPDSPLTHKNTKAWGERLVQFDGDEYRCEWHGKRLWNHDRVHFSLPIVKYQNRVLIGLFVDHLTT